MNRCRFLSALWFPVLAIALAASGGCGELVDESVCAGLPSVTAPGWASVFTGQPPAGSGVPANELFVREERRLAAPIPSSFSNGEVIRSGHGSPSRRDSEVVFVLAHPDRKAGEIGELVDERLGATPELADVGTLLISLVLPEGVSAHDATRRGSAVFIEHE